MRRLIVSVMVALLALVLAALVGRTSDRVFACAPYSTPTVDDATAVRDDKRALDPQDDCHAKRQSDPGSCSDPPGATQQRADLGDAGLAFGQGRA